MSTTFLYTERYGAAVHRFRERLSALGFVLAVLALVAGAAGLVTLQGPYALVDSVRAALSSL
ncbi:MAG TPA: hypothetical protein VKA01_07150 [Vicinamibacteria bacterium]|nr:hypothetical protein [Vicinamibacteria bacterium]